MPRLRYAYNTNGCNNHRLPDALRLIARAGYDGVALTLDWHHLNPLAEDWERRTREVGRLLKQYELGCVIETGARFLLRAEEKHEPTLINPEAEGRALRLKFLRRAIAIAKMLGAETVSCWAGARQEAVSEERAWGYLREGLQELSDYARERSVVLSIEPEPGMLIETNADFEYLVRGLSVDPDYFRLALDLGHVWVTGEDDPARAIRKYADRLGTISIEGMNRGVHLHLPLDEGDMPIPPLLGVLRQVEFSGLVCVELSRASPTAHRSIPDSIALLRRYETTTFQSQNS